MIREVYKKIRLNPSPDMFTLVLLISLLSLSLGVYNNYLIRNGASGTVLTQNGQKVLPVKNLIKNIKPTAEKIGNLDAKVTVVVFEDFQCPFCKRFNTDTFSKIKKEYVDTGKILLIHQDLAFLGEESIRAAEASHCASEQGKFWEFRQLLYENQKGENSGALNDDNLKKFARNMGLNSSEFNSCLDSQRYKKVVDDSRDFANSYGITSTPSFVINGTLVKGAQQFTTFQGIIDGELN